MTPTKGKKYNPCGSDVIYVYDIALYCCLQETHTCAALYNEAGDRVGHVKIQELPGFIHLWQNHQSGVNIVAHEASSRGFRAIIECDWICSQAKVTHTNR